MKAWRLLLLAVFLVLCIVQAHAADGDDDDDFDEDLPVKPAPAPFAPPKPAAAPAGSLMSIDWNRVKPRISDFVPEYVALALVIGYAAIYFSGNKTNKEAAEQWFKTTKDVWARNFTQVGDNRGTIFRDSPRDYLFYASGRLHVKYLYGYLKFLPRHDIIQSLIDMLWPGSYDRLTFKIALNNEESDNFVFAIVQKNKAKEFTKGRWDLETFSKPRDLVKLSQYYIMMTDAPEFATQLTSEPRIIKLLYASLGLNDKGEGKPLAKPLIESIEISDMPKQKPERVAQIEECPKRMIITFALPLLSKKPEDRQRIVQMSELVVDLIDAVGQFGRLSFEASSKLKKLRQVATEIIQKEEDKSKVDDLSKKKAEAKKKREEELAKLTPEARRKAEEKERKREEKKANTKAMKKGRVMF